jgi:hypothetical protein
MLQKTRTVPDHHQSHDERADKNGPFYRILFAQVLLGQRIVH